MASNLLVVIVNSGKIPISVPSLLVYCLYHSLAAREHLVTDSIVAKKSLCHLCRILKRVAKRDRGPYRLALTKKSRHVERIVPVTVARVNESVLTNVIRRKSHCGKDMLPNGVLTLIKIFYGMREEFHVACFLYVSIYRRSYPSRSVGIYVMVKRQPSANTTAVIVHISKGLKNFFLCERRIKGGNRPRILKLIAEALTCITAYLGAKLNLLLKPVVSKAVYLLTRSAYVNA